MLCILYPVLVQPRNTGKHCNTTEKLLSGTFLDLWEVYIGLDKQNFLRKIVNIFLPIIFSICFGCSKEMSH